MEIIPAIDIRGGKCVRLYEGDYSREIVFDEDPAAVASRWRDQGAHWLHVVDLDGAAVGEPQNIATIEKILSESHLLVELGGGIRKEATVEALLRKGVDRVILGTAAVENPALVSQLCRRFGETIAVGLDARDGKLAVHGWQKDTDIEVLQLAQEMLEIGVRRFICTDVKRDGTLTEPNFDLVGKLVSWLNVPIIASGGISKLDHLRRLKELGVEGAIVGKALYTGAINLREAIDSL